MLRARSVPEGAGVAETSEAAFQVRAQVRAARDGDRAAFGRLYDRYARMVHGILMARVPLAEVDDLVQDVFVRALNQVHTLRDVDCFGGWLAAVTRNRANDYHRRSVEVGEVTEEHKSPARSGRGGGPRGDEGAGKIGNNRELPEGHRGGVD